MADAAGGEAHEHLTRPGPVELDVLDGERLGELLQNGGANPHGAETLRRLRRSAGDAGRSRRRPATLTVRFHEGEPGAAGSTVRSGWRTQVGT